jgi:hypothetical protein
MLIAANVPNEVWASLPERRLPRWRVLGALVLLAALTFGAYTAAQAGVLAPNIRAETHGGSWTEGSGSFTTVTTLVNEGAVPTTIESAAVTGSWLRLDRVTLADQSSAGDAAPTSFPVTLGAHEGVSVEFWFTVTDCSRVDRAGLALSVQATSPRRTTSVDITPRGDQDPAAPSSYSWSEGADPWNVPWPGTYAASACGVHLPPKA